MFQYSHQTYKQNSLVAPSTYLSHIIDSNENGPSPSRRMRWHNVHGFVDVNESTAGEFGDLVVSHLVEFGAHFAQAADPGHAAELVAVQHAQQSRRAGASGFASGVGEFKLW